MRVLAADWPAEAGRGRTTCVQRGRWEGEAASSGSCPGGEQPAGAGSTRAARGRAGGFGCEARSSATARRFDILLARCAAFSRRRDARTVWQLACWHERAAQEQRSAVGARIAALLRRLWAYSAGYVQSGAARADPLAWSGTRALAQWSLCAGAERRFATAVHHSQDLGCSCFNLRAS